ncbi:MAG: rod shape-determining protein MreD [Rickettsiales bacterium]|jgi:rod shape-determining protein MreD|nr:rod shape-determining protein MreD [Rickettsiales bacterium]
MRTAVWQSLDIAARKFTPFLVALALVIVNLVPLHLPGYATISPDLVLMAVYYWALHRPSLMPAIAVFILGLFQDFLSGGPIGLSAGSLILVFAVAVSQARFFYGKSFLVVWWGFMMVSVGVGIIQWSVACIFLGRLISPDPALFECAMNIAAYPILGWLFFQIHRTLPAGD